MRPGHPFERRKLIRLFNGPANWGGNVPCVRSVRQHLRI